MDRFVKDWTRGAVATKEFYSLMSGNTGEWQEQPRRPRRN